MTKKIQVGIESIRFKINKDEAKKIIKGAGISIGGIILTLLADLVKVIDVDIYTAIFVGVSSILINAARKFLEGKKE